MSDITNVAYQYGLNPMEEEDDVRHDKKVVLLKIIVAVLGVFLLIEGLLYTLVIPCLAPARIEFSGLRMLNAPELCALLNETAPSSSWMKFDTSKAASVLTSVSSIESVSVDKHFPDRVVVHVQERIPVARTILSVQNKSTPVLIDRNGVMFSVPSFKADSSIPLVSGLPVNDAQSGMRIPQTYRSLIAQIANLRALPQKYFSAVSEICVMPKEYGNYELVLYPIHTHIRVLTGRDLQEDDLKYMMVLLDVVKSIDANVSLVDLRYGAVSYRSKEQ